MRKLLLITASIIFTFNGFAQNKSTEKPNVVLVLADNVGYGDACEGSIRTIGMMKWSGKIKAGSRSNEMISVHDFQPTFANILGEELPDNRYYDGFDQTDFIPGKLKKSNRNHFITFIGDRVAAVRWNQFKIYPLIVAHTNSNPTVGGYLGTLKETAGFPQIFNIETDPKERIDFTAYGAGWIMGPYMLTVAAYKKTLEKCPNPPVPNLTKLHL